ncbi:MAG: hypothetical protein RI947_267 [Candidatus Parcubacteria bacterium]
MQISLLTYNLLFNNALKQIQTILMQYQPDIVCLQEMETREDDFKQLEKSGYKLADFSNSFIKHGKIYGIATFYRATSLHFVESTSLTLPRTYYEVLLFILNGAHNPRTVLKTEFLVRGTKKRLTTYNLHLSPWATNGARVRQITKTLSDLRIFNKRNVLIAGDFNYPYGRRKFEELIKQYDLSEATNNLLYTLEQSFFRYFTVKLKLDYILYKSLKLIETNRIPINYSDHFPIISKFEI